MDERSPQLTDTPRSHEDWWAGPTWMVSASAAGAAPVFVASGYLERLWRWERRFRGIPQTAPLDETWPTANDTTYLGPTNLLLRRGWSSIELELVEDSLSASELQTLLTAAIGDDADTVVEAMSLPPVPANANRPLFTSSGNNVFDLVLPTLPSRRGDHDLALNFGSRIARLVTFSYGHVVVWRAIDGPWDLETVRWPHYGIPSRSASWESEAFFSDATAAQRLLRFVHDFCGHVNYQMGTWSVEQELWEHNFFANLAAGPSTFSGLTLGRHQKELAALADFLGTARQAQRAISRRSAVDPSLSQPEVRSTMQRSGDELDRSLVRARDVIRESFALISNVANGEQNLIAEQQRDATNRLQEVITLATTVLLVPALVVAVYGANIRELSPDSSGDLSGLLILTVSTSIAATIAVRAATGRTLLARRWGLADRVVAALGLLIALVGLVSLSMDWLRPLVALSLGSVGVVLGGAALWNMFRTGPRETSD